ncbi:hypothetical protein NKDENANG_02548 [Candidatus Entotheonellaceae bacterium PAL068K]
MQTSSATSHSEGVPSMTEPASVLTIFCAQCSRNAQVRRGDPLPEGWTEYPGQLTCSEECADILRSMGLIFEA